ncbi:MAG TPA: hypothetical protein VGO58_03120 [Chitinophagaceae bacterium]|jgi:hypothetical protein|nr:hypothetical protein [Chitinophagaceae bacterium]
MKKLLLLSIIITMLSLAGMTQQGMTTKIARDIPAVAAVKAAMGVAEVPATPAIPHKVLSLYGIGNLNTETLNKLNSSGKIAVSIIPWFNSKNSRYWEVYLSFNKNATNNDSILASTLLFPEVGNHSFLATVRRIYPIKGQSEHFLSPFFEFSQKNIKVDTSSVQGKTTSGHFSTLTYTLGYSYIFSHVAGETQFGFSFTPYISALNIPDEDNADYRKIFNSLTLPSEIWSFGFKTVFQIKGFQIFADMRHVLGSEKKISIREMRGFNSNVGVTFNADIFEL